MNTSIRLLAHLGLVLSVTVAVSAVAAADPSPDYEAGFAAGQASCEQTLWTCTTTCPVTNGSSRSFVGDGYSKAQAYKPLLDQTTYYCSDTNYGRVAGHVTCTQLVGGAQ